MSTSIPPLKFHALSSEDVSGGEIKLSPVAVEAVHLSGDKKLSPAQNSPEIKSRAARMAKFCRMDSFEEALGLSPSHSPISPRSPHSPSSPKSSVEYLGTSASSTGSPLYSKAGRAQLLKLLLRSSHEEKENSSSESLLRLAQEEFDEKYTIGELLGTGATCSVHVGVEKDTKREVAIKIIQGSVVKSNKGLIQEINLLRKLDHPHIIHLIDFIATETKLYIIMELAYGPELFDMIVDKRTYTEADACQLVKQVVSGLAYMHKKGIAHRDLKPENLLFDTNEENARLKIVDFGLSKRDSGSGFNTPIGTLGYKAPEMFGTDSYSKAVDMWSLGVITYIMLCGFPPFFSDPDYRDPDFMENTPFWVFFNDNTSDLRDGITSGVIEFPEPFWTKISKNAKDFVRKLLVRDPVERYTAEKALQHPWMVSENVAEQKTHIIRVPKVLSKFDQIQEKLRLRLKERSNRMELQDRNILRSPRRLSHSLASQQQLLERSISKVRLQSYLNSRPTLKQLVDRGLIPDYYIMSVLDVEAESQRRHSEKRKVVHEKNRCMTISMPVLPSDGFITRSRSCSEISVLDEGARATAAASAALCVPHDTVPPLAAVASQHVALDEAQADPTKTPQLEGRQGRDQALTHQLHPCISSMRQSKVPVTPPPLRRSVHEKCTNPTGIVFPETPRGREYVFPATPRESPAPSRHVMKRDQSPFVSPAVVRRKSKENHHAFSKTCDSNHTIPSEVSLFVTPSPSSVRKEKS